MKVKVKSLSCVRLFVTPWTVAYQAPLSMGFSRQEYWSGLPFPSQLRRQHALVKLAHNGTLKQNSFLVKGGGENGHGTPCIDVMCVCLHVCSVAKLSDSLQPHGL